MQFDTLRPVRLVSLAGQAMLLQPADPRAVPPALQADALAKGCVPRQAKPEAKPQQTLSLTKRKR